MAQTVVLTSQTAADDGDDFVVELTPVTLTLYTDETDGNPGRAKLLIQEKGPGNVYAAYYTNQTQRQRNRPTYLTNTMRTVVINSPGTFRVNKTSTTKKVGAYTEDGT